MGGSIMGNAGRVLMIPKGDYNPATPYEMLDCVYYNGRSYVCKQASTGHAPTDIMYWQPMTPDSSAEIQALTNQLNTSINDLGAKNSFPLSVAKIKALNPDVTWTDNSCVWKGITYTILTDSAGNVTGIDADGTATERGWLFLTDNDFGNASINFGLNPTVDGYTYSIGGSGWLTNILDVVYNYGLKKSYYLIDNGQTLSHKVAYPMRRPAGITDDTFAPYAKTNVELTQLGVYYNTSNDSISLPTGTEPEIINISNLPAGVYIVSAMVRGYPNTECDKYARVLSSNDSNIARIQGVSKIEDISISAVVNIPVNNGTISIKAYQNSGSTVTLNARLDIVRVG